MSAKALAHKGSVRFDFSKCNFLKPNAVAVLGAIARKIQHRGFKASFKWNSLHQALLNNLKQNGFYSAFGGVGGPWPGNSVPYLELRDPDPAATIGYLVEKWLGRGWIDISPLLRGRIVGRVYELFENAFDHAQSPIGLTCCGQYFPKLKSLHLVVVDVGVGIPANVREFHGQPDIDAAESLCWAFQAGTTTKTGNTARGLGLDFLKNFMMINGGELKAYSLDGFAVVDKSRETYDTHGATFGGTLVSIRIQCDEAFYLLASEVPSTPFF